MSQAEKAPAVMVRIERALEKLISDSDYHDKGRILLEQGWIDIEWAADHTRFDALKDELASRTSSSLGPE